MGAWVVPSGGDAVVAALPQPGVLAGGAPGAAATTTDRCAGSGVLAVGCRKGLGN